MAQISRLKNDEIEGGNTIFADDIDAELDQLVNESNSQDTRITTIESSDYTFTGIKTFSSAPKMDQIDEKTVRAGVTIDGVRLKDKAIRPYIEGATFSGVNTSTDLVTTVAAHGLDSGDPVQFTTSDTLPDPLAVDTVYYVGGGGDFTTTTFKIYTDSGLNTLVDITDTGTGTHRVASRPGDPDEGEIWYNEESAVVQYEDDAGVETIATLNDINQVTGPRFYVAGAAPIYLTAATFSIAELLAKSQDNNNLIEITSSKTLNLGNTGLNGIAQSADLDGTVSTTASSATITGSGTDFTNDFVAGDVITIAGGDSLVIDSVASGTSMTATSNASSTVSGATYKRGGEANGAWYYLYAIDNGTTPGYILSARSVNLGNTLVDLPSGYTISRELALAVKNDDSGDLVPFTVGNGWPSRPYIQYEVTHHSWGGTVGPTNVLESGNNSPAATFADVDCSAFVPKTSKIAKLYLISGTTSNVAGFVRANGATHNGAPYSSVNASAIPPRVEIPTDASQMIEYNRSINAATTLDINIVGFTVTEVV